MVNTILLQKSKSYNDIIILPNPLYAVDYPDALFTLGFMFPHTSSM